MHTADIFPAQIVIFDSNFNILCISNRVSIRCGQKTVTVGRPLVQTSAANTNCTCTGWVSSDCFDYTISHIQGGPAKVRPAYIFDGNISMHR